MLPGIQAMVQGRMVGDQLYDFIFKLFVPIGLLLFGGLQFEAAPPPPPPAPVSPTGVERRAKHAGLLQSVDYEQKKPIFVVLYPWLILILPIYIFALNANRYLEDATSNTVSYLVSYFIMYLPGALLLCVLSYLNQRKVIYMSCNVLVTLLFLPFLFPKFVVKLFN